MVSVARFRALPAQFRGLSAGRLAALPLRPLETARCSSGGRPSKGPKVVHEDLAEGGGELLGGEGRLANQALIQDAAKREDIDGRGQPGLATHKLGRHVAISSRIAGSRLFGVSMLRLGYL